jgi:hypothetical protein
MSFDLVASGGAARESLLSRLTREVRTARPRAVGVATAYLSAFGVTELRRLTAPAIRECRLIAGINGEITHPTSLSMALSYGWDVRIGAGGRGIFHPKMIVGGNSFSSNGLLTDTSCLYVGSGNITRGGLSANVECGIFSTDKASLSDFSQYYSELWDSARELTRPLLDEYAEKFAKRNRARSARDLVFLGVADQIHRVGASVSRLRAETPPQETQRAIDTRHANVAWAGLQSFTGEFQFQIEFPRAAGEVIQSLIRGLRPGARIQVECEDGVVRSMNFRYYADNSMFRLNVPFEVPGVDWARTNRDGIAVLTRGRDPSTLRLRILKPGRQADEIIGRSIALGTWGKTSTRLYGWM